MTLTETEIESVIVPLTVTERRLTAGETISMRHCWRSSHLWTGRTRLLGGGFVLSFLISLSVYWFVRGKCRAEDTHRLRPAFLRMDCFH